MYQTGIKVGSTGEAHFIRMSRFVKVRPFSPTPTPPTPSQHPLPRPPFFFFFFFFRESGCGGFFLFFFLFSKFQSFDGLVVSLYYFVSTNPSNDLVSRRPFEVLLISWYYYIYIYIHKHSLIVEAGSVFPRYCIQKKGQSELLLLDSFGA